MENPNHKWRFRSLGKSSISMGHLYHGYVTNNQRVSSWENHLHISMGHGFHGYVTNNQRVIPTIFPCPHEDPRDQATSPSTAAASHPPRPSAAASPPAPRSASAAARCAASRWRGGSRRARRRGARGRRGAGGSGRSRRTCTWEVLSIGSMYDIFANIWGILMVNVTIYGIHGSYGLEHDTSMEIVGWQIIEIFNGQ